MMHTPRTARPPPPRPACVPALPDLSALLPKARPAPVHPNPFPLPVGRRHPIDPRPRSTQIDVSYAIGRGKTLNALPPAQPAPVALKASKCNVPAWQQQSAAAAGDGSAKRTISQRSTTTTGRAGTTRTALIPFTASPFSSRTSDSSPSSDPTNKAAEAVIVVSSTPPRTAVKPAFAPCSAYPACLPAAGDVRPRSRVGSSHSFRSPPRSTAANPQRLDCSPAFRGLTPRKTVGAEHAADVAWLDSGVRGQGWGLDEKSEQTSVEAPAEKKRASGPIRSTTRSVSAAQPDSLADTAASSTLSTSRPRRRSAVGSPSAEPHSIIPSVEPAAFLSLIKTDPTRAFQLIFPDYDIDDDARSASTTGHTATHSRGRHVEEEKEEAADVAVQPASPSPLSPYSAGWRYQQTAAFDVQRPDTAGERRQRTEEVKEQIADERIHSVGSDEEEDEEEDGEAEQEPADAWTRDVVQRIVSQASRSWEEPTTLQRDPEQYEHEAEADGRVADRADDSAEEAAESSYSEDEVEEEQWPAADEDEEDNSQPSTVETVTVSPPSPPSARHDISHISSVFDRKRPSPVSTHFLRPEQAAAASASPQSSHSASSTHSSLAASAVDESPSSQHTSSPFTIVPSAPGTPAASASDHERSTSGGGRPQPQQEDEDSLFEL